MLEEALKGLDKLLLNRLKKDLGVLLTGGDGLEEKLFMRVPKNDLEPLADGAARRDEFCSVRELQRASW